MKPRFQPDIGAGGNVQPARVWIDPEAFDASEQQFAASLEEKRENSRPRFVVETESKENQGLNTNTGESQKSPEFSNVAEKESAERESKPESVLQPEDPESWRREVASKVSRYRSRRRPRAPHYPSLLLRFESNETGEAHPEPAIVAPSRRATAVHVDSHQAQSEPEPLTPLEGRPASADTGAKILEFPSPLTAPSNRRDELADPVLATPRILEVPEVLPPPPAMGGILIEATEETSQDRRPGFELPLQAAPMAQRILASMTDVLLVIMAFALFAYTFFRMTSTVPPLRVTAVVTAGLIFVFWAGYQYLLLVYSGGTPGLKLAKLRLSRFDGSPVPRRIRRWRVIASILSGLSLGLGYAWCFLDEDELCWHDRITRTYMAPKTPGS